MPTSSTHVLETKPSPNAAADFAHCDTHFDAERVMGRTDCPEGCEVEPDGICSHGWESAGLTAGLV